MELKKYQQDSINDLSRFLEYIQKTKNISTAFQKYWNEHPRTPLAPTKGKGIEPYKNNVPKVPNVCIKVPTAGGKTFIACNALKTIFDAFDYNKTKAVVWLVPSITILDQTIINLKDASHPYRQKINSHFGNRVEVFDKSALLQGSGLNSTSIKEQLNIFVLSFDSLRAKNKEDRKVYQENSNLQSFETMMGSDEEISLMKVIQTLNPVVVVDESHNAETELSIEMLVNLNPCFILDLTATPRNNSNIISFVDAIELKKENMVKLPVIVYNHHDKTDVIISAIQLQRKLELQAKEEEKNGGKYIRPIVLFQAEPRNAEENTTFEKLREKLIEFKIPAEQIKIKTANLNELKNEDLLSSDCKVRFIITINALKEGWDCPFAYILATLADKSSAVDVEQILGRILRQPYVKKHNYPLLNLSYVLTASAKFLDTLDNIVKGLNKAGFSESDYKLAETAFPENEKQQEEIEQLSIEQTDDNSFDDIIDDIDQSRILALSDAESNHDSITEIELTALKQNEEFEKVISELEANNSISLPNELQSLVKTYTIKKDFKELASKVVLPQFFMKFPTGDIFGNEEEESLLENEFLLNGFKLSMEDVKINFENVASELYKVDLDESKKEHTPSFVKLDGKFKERNLLLHILEPSYKPTRVKNLSKRIMSLMGKMDPIADKEIEKYINRILESFSDDQFKDFVSKEHSYIRKIKEKINSLSESYAEKKFNDYVATDKVFIKPSYTFANEISPGETSKDIINSLYEKEGKINSYEEKIINEIANLDSVKFWTRNDPRKGFRINGFINHYPDFIIQTKNGKTIVLETKGDHLDAQKKMRLGRQWTENAGNNFKYYLVYEKRIVDGVYILDDFINMVREM